MAILLLPLSFLLVRLPLALIQRTPFQPDESYQSLEPAHHLVFHYGHLTWEWTPNPPINDVWWGWMGEGRLRGSLPIVLWAAVYHAISFFSLDTTTALVLAPKILMALLSSLCDLSTYTLASKLFNRQVAKTAVRTSYTWLIAFKLTVRSQLQLFLSLSSLFYAHALSRPFTNSLETILMVCALNFWPFPPSVEPIKGKDDPSGKAEGEVNRKARSVRLCWLLLSIEYD